MVKGVTGKKLREVLDTKLKKKLIKKAKKLHSRIFPCGMKSSLEECFTVSDEKILLWYNTRDQNTYVVMAPQRLNNRHQVR